MQSETLAQEFARLVKEYHEGDDHTKPEAWNLLADYAVDNADAISAALSDKQAGEVKIKPLEWKETSDDSGRYATVNTSVGSYDAFELSLNVRGGSRTMFGWTGHWMNGDQKADSFEAAKAAAQADYEQRIRSALVDVPAVEPVAWREIEGYQGLYEVSSGGDVRSIQTGRLLAKNLAGSGYVKADLWKNGKRWQTTVHRLVADAFLEKQGSEINHINGIKTDNRVENLEWCSRSENVSHSFYVLSKRVRPVEAYNPGTGEKRHYRSVCEAARDGFKSSQIYRALKNHNRTVKGFHWQEVSPPLSLEGEDSAEVIEEGAKVLAAWLKHSWEGLGDRDISDSYPDFTKIPHFQGGKPALRKVAASIIALAATRSGSATTASGDQP
ncbi:NUMOD4 motif-containing HNH endonuclease [Shinella fusca]|uniref:HNH nuclease domain-containing protein n=1 Tax=Shinella fusca TaxID=544480 RepID=A0A7W8DTG1_9HYPH|nr:NUMOD4 motif-containing HNH endonuclease [Shinella fusca]MBB5040851.1 hypothetical protein [Shinella fusca]